MYFSLTLTFLTFLFLPRICIANPAVTTPTPVLKSVQMLVPYMDLSKVLENKVSQYIILPLGEYEKLFSQKEASLASKTSETPSQPPVTFRLASARFDGILKGNFAHIDLDVTIESLVDGWQTVELLKGALALASASLDGADVSLVPNWNSTQVKPVKFHQLSPKNLHDDEFLGEKRESLSQENWKELGYSLSFRGKGRHECSVSMIVPVDQTDERYSINVGISPIPLSSFKLHVPDYVATVETSSLSDLYVEEDSVDPTGEKTDIKGCSMLGWLGAINEIQISWRKRLQPKSVPSAISPAKQHPSSTLGTSLGTGTTEPAAISIPTKPSAQPLIYAHSETLFTLGEGALQGRMDIEYSVTKAPVSRFEIQIPDTVEILGVTSDRSISHFIVKENGVRRLTIDFSVGRIEGCPVTIVFEAKMENTEGAYRLPEISLLGVVRELGCIGVEALTSVEVQESINTGNLQTASRFDPSELPESLRKRTSRPILLAFRHSKRPVNLGIEVKRYKDLAQQTVVADFMNAKTSFTTNKTSNTMVNLRIKNNNRQYLNVFLASDAEMLGAFLNDKSVSVVTDGESGKVLIPLPMSKTLGKPEIMDLRFLYKQPIATMSWSGELGFIAPLIDIPVSHFSWTIFSPEQFYLFSFVGTVKTALSTPDPFIFRGFLSLYVYLWLIVDRYGPFLLFVGIFSLFFILLFVSRSLLLKTWEAVWNFAESVFVFLFSAAGVGFGGILIIGCIIAILAAIAIPNFKKAREQARDKACYANQRVILGAVEMYNMDHSAMMDSIVDSDVRNAHSLLLAGGYLKNSISNPEAGCNYGGSSLTTTGEIFCRIHGSVSGTYEEAKRKASESPKPFQISEKPSEPLNGENRAVPRLLPGGKAAGVKPIEARFISTANYYNLERDLVISDATGTGKIVANLTCPTVQFKYMDAWVGTAFKIVSFTLGAFMGVYFILGAIFRRFANFILSGFILVILSILDSASPLLGDLANKGLWLTLFGGVVWKIVWLISLHRNQPINLNVEKNPNPTSKPILFLILLSILIFPETFSFGSKAFGAQPSREIRVMVPFSDVSKVVETGGKMVILPEEDYRYLIDIEAPKKPEAPLAPLDFAVRSVQYRGKIEERGVQFNSKFEIDCFNPGWKVLRLFSTAVIPSKALLDGESVALDVFPGQDPQESFYGLISETLGYHVIEVCFFLPFSSRSENARKFEFKTLPVARSTMEISVPENDCEVLIDPGVISQISSSASGAIFFAQLSPSKTVRFEWFKRASIPEEQGLLASETAASQPIPLKSPIELVQEETRLTIAEANLLMFEEGFVRGRFQYTIDAIGGEGISTFSFMVPPRLTILKVDGNFIEDWKVETEPGLLQKRLNVSFHSRMKGSMKFSVEFEEDLQNISDNEYEVPEIVPLRVDRTVGILCLGAIPSLDLVAKKNLEGYSPIDSAEFRSNFSGALPEKLPYSFKYSKHPNKLAVSMTRHKDAVVLSAIVDKVEAATLLNEEGYLITRVAYEVRNNSDQFLKLELPVLKGTRAELWSSEVGGMAVKAGFDPELSTYNIPIIRSPILENEVKSFPVEIICAINLNEPLRPFLPVRLQLPRVNLSVSELNWVVYLPEGFELMRGKGNLNIMQSKPDQALLEGRKKFEGLNMDSLLNTRTQVGFSGTQESESDRLIGMLGRLPVKFSVPFTNWYTAYSMLQIEPTDEVPHMDGILVTPKSGEGKWLNYGMIAIGGIAGLAVLFLFTHERRWVWFFVTAICAITLGILLLLKLYQADHSFSMGFLAFFVTGFLYSLFRWNPKQST
ncbi:hypothetical protein HYY75_05415 [bacterium]|nr:hypothetical protein [bacterium]